MVLSPLCGIALIASYVQIASTWTDALEILLDAYEQIGEQIPLLQQFHALFKENEHMQRVLALMYSDIIDFHQRAVRMFSDPSRCRFPI